MIFAVILTYNRPELIREALASLLKQSRKIDQIVIVDNGSEIPAEVAVRDIVLPENICFLRLPTNIGSHKGFEAGFEFFKQQANPGDWLWVLDDDAHPVPEALEKLISYSDISSVITPNKLSPDGSLFPLLHFYSSDDGTRKYSKKSNPKGWSSTNIVSFEGLLISYGSLARVPTLDFNLFICDDDTLFGELVSIFENPIIVNEPLLHRKFADNGLASWKIYYAVRNKIILRKILLDVKYRYSLRSSLIFILNIFIDIAFYISRDPKNIRGAILGLVQGFRFKGQLKLNKEDEL